MQTGLPPWLLGLAIALGTGATHGIAQIQQPLEAGTRLVSAGGGVPATSLWIERLDLRRNETAGDSWTAVLRLNRDRRRSRGFDATSEDLEVLLGSQRVFVPAGSLLDRRGVLDHSFDEGSERIRLRFRPKEERLEVRVQGTQIRETFPAELELRVSLGADVRSSTVELDEQGRIRNRQNVALVVTKCSFAGLRPGSEKLDLAGFFHDPGFLFDPRRDAFTIRLRHGERTVFEREFSAQLQRWSVFDTHGILVPLLRARTERIGRDALKNFEYDGSTGAFRAVFANTDLSDLVGSGAAQLSLEIEVGVRTYQAGFTVFEGRPARFATTY